MKSITIIKSQLVTKGEKIADVRLSIEGRSNEIYTELSSLLESFGSKPELSIIFYKVLSKLVEKKEDKYDN